MNRLSILFSIFFLLLIGCTQEPQNKKKESPEIEKYGQEFKGKIAKSYDQSEEWWPSSPKPEKGTPNVLLILLDDTGFGHLGSFGGLT